MDSSKRWTAAVTLVGKNFVVVGSGQFYASACSDQAKRITKAHTRARIGAISEESGEKKFRCRSVHRKCTNHPQVFHSLDLHRPRTLRLKLHVQPYGGGRDRCGRARHSDLRGGSLRGRRCHAAARVSDRRHVARQLRRAGARRRSRDLFDADRNDAESAAASRQSSRRSRRLGSHQPLRRHRPHDALRADAGGGRLRRAFESGGDDAEPGGPHARPGAAARHRRARAADARRLAAEPLQLPSGRSPADVVAAGRSDRRPARGARRAAGSI